MEKSHLTNVKKIAKILSVQKAGVILQCNQGTEVTNNEIAALKGCAFVWHVKRIHQNRALKVDMMKKVINPNKIGNNRETLSIWALIAYLLGI